MQFLFLFEIVVSAKDQFWAEGRSKERRMDGKKEEGGKGWNEKKNKTKKENRKVNNTFSSCV